MEGLTHISVGMALSMLVTPIEAPADYVYALAGGALGGILADLDLWKTNNKRKNEAIQTESIVVLLFFAAFLIDFFSEKLLLQHILSERFMTIIGAIGFLILIVISLRSQHRGFTHSIAAMFLYTFFVFGIYPPVGMACFVSYISHLLLDLLNKKGIRLFFPVTRKYCLKICAYDKTTNTVIMYIGFALTIFLLIMRIIVNSNIS